MGSSRASTPAGRRRTSRRASAAKRATRSRSGAGHTKKPPKPRPKPKPKPKRAAKAKPKRAAVPPSRSKKPRASSKPAASSPGAAASILRPRSLLVLVGLLLCLAAAYFLWFRDSSFVAVEEVAVEGIDGPESEAVTAALTKSASSMSTLHVREEELSAAVARFPTVVGVSAEGDFPHGLTIHVTERPPVLNAGSGDRTVAVAADGTILPGVDASEAGLPSVEVGELPASGKLSGDALEIALVAGAAPEPLRPLLDGFSISDQGSVEVELRGAIPVFFGGSDRAGEKWSAIAAILANPKIDTLTHIDVRVPERPSVGGAAPPPGEEQTTEVAEVAPETL